MLTFSRCAALLAVALSLVACQNFTEAPLCNDANAAAPLGLRGTYTQTNQGNDYSTTVQRYVIDFDDTDHMTVLRDGALMAQTPRLCQVGGRLIAEERDDNGYYRQSQVFISDTGLSILPLLYDRSGLEAAGVATETIAMLARAQAKGLLVRNDGVDPRVVVGQAKSGSVGLTLLRSPR